MKNKIISAILALGMLSYIPANAMSKDETVYSKLNNDGSVKSTIVTEHLINNQNEEKIKDTTNLKDLVNVNGDETLKLVDNKLDIETKGEDVYYRGTTDKELPIKVELKYELNEKEIALKDLLGKKGNVKITINYINKDSHNVNGNILYTPFVVLTTFALDNTTNKNINVSNGKVISTGTRSMITSITSPGLDSSLGIQMDVLNKTEITFETTNFVLPNICFAYTSKILDSNDLEIFNKIDDLHSKMLALKNSSEQIEKGTSDLLDGLNKLNEASNNLSNGVTSLAGYISQAKDGSVKLDSVIKLMISKLSGTDMGIDQEKLNQIQNLMLNKRTHTSVRSQNPTLLN